MGSGRVNSYKGYIGNKRTYLKRKKQLNREIRYFKKRKRKCYIKSIGRRYFQNIINRKKDDVYILRLMWNYNKFGYRRAKRVKRGLPVK